MLSHYTACVLLLHVDHKPSNEVPCNSPDRCVACSVPGASFGLGRDPRNTCRSPLAVIFLS